LIAKLRSVRSVVPFHRLIAASGASNLADGALLTVMPLVALSITREPAAFATVAVAGRLPWLLVALPAGALNDRLDRRSTMRRVNLARAGLIGALALVVASGNQQLWMLYVVAFALGVGETFHDTAAQSIVPALVADTVPLERVNSRLYAVELSANQFIGPALGGVVAGLALTAGLSASAVAYLVAAIVLTTIAGHFRPATPAVAARLRTDIAEGVRYLAHHQLLRALAVCVGISNLASAAVFAVFPLYAIAPGPMGLDGAGFGLLLAAIAAGSVAGSFVVDPLVRSVGQRRTLLLSMSASAIMPLAPALSDEAWVVAVIFAAAAAFGIGWNVITVSLRQRIVPDHLLARVNAGYRVLAWGTMPIGAALGGLVAARFGLTAVFWTSATLGALCLPIILHQVTTGRLTASNAGSSATDHAHRLDERDNGPGSERLGAEPSQDGDDPRPDGRIPATADDRPARRAGRWRR
jgi:MFS family permease